jgi:hypothetical protein
MEGRFHQSQCDERRRGDEEGECVERHDDRSTCRGVQAGSGEWSDQSQSFSHGAQGAVGVGESVVVRDLLE